jgi:prepilin-type N-terminal cleavage/methylation domain-containing protein
VSRRGFTLVEVLVALAVGTAVVLLAHRTLLEASAIGSGVAQRRQAHDRLMNARRFLIQVFGSLEVGSVANSGFWGTTDAVAFTAWLPDESGASIRRRVSVVLGDVAAAGGVRLVAFVYPREESDGAAAATDTLVLMPSVSGLALDYLLDFGADAAWVQEWRSPVTAPLAVRLRVASDSGVDTLLFAIGPRG